MGLRGLARRRLAALVFVPWFTVACGSTQSASHGTVMQMQPGAEKMHTAFVAPADGVIVTQNVVRVKINITGFDIRCDLAGKKPQQGTGHYHLLLEGELINMYCTPDAVISMQNVKPGKHKLTVVPAQNDHAEIEDNKQTITFDYEPSAPLPTIAAAANLGRPSIKILSPAPGSTISGNFDVTVQVAHLNFSCDLFGKPAVKGYGHWHLNVDSDTGPMMGMGGMLGMSCVKVFRASASGLKPGTTHTLIAVLVNNGHAPFHPDIADRVQVTIGS